MNFYSKQRNLLLSVAWIISCSFTAVSQLRTDSVELLREIVVTSDANRKQTQSASPYQILDKGKLEMLNALQVSDAVKHFSGVTVKDYGGIGGLKTVSVRSLGANHTMVVYDGVAVSDVQTGQIDIGRFSLDNVETISLGIGQSDNIFQPAQSFASASAIHIRTRRPVFGKHQSAEGKVALKAGSFGLVNPAFSLYGKHNSSLSSSFSGEWLSSNGKYPYTLNYGVAGVDSSSVEIRQNTDVHNLRLEGTLFADFKEKSSGYLKAYYYRSERGLPGAIIYYNTKNPSSQRAWDNTFFTQANYHNKLSQRWELQANAKYNLNHLRYLEPFTRNDIDKAENSYTGQELYGSVSALFRIAKEVSVSASTDIIYNHLQADTDNFAYPSRITSLSVLAAKHVSEHLLASVSLLHTQTYETVKTGEPADNQSKWSPYAGISIKPFGAADLHLRAFYKNIFRLPTFADLYYARIGNRDLKPENTDQFNAGITYSVSTGKWLNLFLVTADIYHNSVRNKIVAFPAKNIFEWSMLNYGTVKINGLDMGFDAVFRLADRYNLTLGGTHTYQRALNRTNKADRDYGHQIPYTPRVSGSAKSRLETPWAVLSCTMIWSGHRYTLSQNFAENRLPGFADYGASVSRNFNIKYGTLGVVVEVLNLLNKNYEIVRSFPMPGRSYRATVSFDL